MFLLLILIWQLLLQSILSYKKNQLKSEASGRIKSLNSEGKIPKDSNCADSSRSISNVVI